MNTPIPLHNREQNADSLKNISRKCPEDSKLYTLDIKEKSDFYIQLEIEGLQII